MREAPRRRRRDDEPSGGGLPLFPLVLVVILAGLLLGGVLAHFFGGSYSAPKSAPTAVAVQPEPLESSPATTAPAFSTPLPTFAPPPTQIPSALPSATPSVPPTAKIVATPKRVASVAASATPSEAPSATPTPVSTATPLAHVAATPKLVAPTSAAQVPAKPIQAVTSDDRASAIVRAYLNALARGDRSTAAGYLARGTPSEVFMNTGARIESIRSANVGSEQYKVTADVQTGNGEYYVTFTVEPGPAGLQITDHYAIKTQ